MYKENIQAVGRTVVDVKQSLILSAPRYLALSGGKHPGRHGRFLMSATTWVPTY